MGVLAKWSRKYDLNDTRKNPAKRIETDMNILSTARLSAMATRVPVLNDLQKLSIREQIADGLPRETIAAEMGVTLKQVDAIQAHVTMAERKEKRTGEEMLARAYNYAKARAKKKKQNCLSKAQCEDLLKQQRGLCAISGKPFSDLVVNSRAKVLSRPWRPSLDRINPKGGYERRNVRLVAQIVNFGLGEWPLEVFREMCRLVAAK